MKQYKFRDLVLATIIGGVVFGGIGVSAVTLTADQIKYTPSNENFTATNAKEALDEIYIIAEKAESIVKENELKDSITMLYWLVEYYYTQGHSVYPQRSYVDINTQGYNKLSTASVYNSSDGIFQLYSYNDDGTTSLIYTSGSDLVVTDFDVSQYDKIRIEGFISNYAFNTVAVNVTLSK